MSSEISLSSVDFDEYERYYRSSFSPTTPSAINMHDRICVQVGNCSPYTKTVVLQTTRSEVEEKTQRIARQNGREIAPMGVSGEAGVTIEWGSKGTEVSAYVSGKASDDNGNQAEVKVEVNDDGSGSATVSVSHDED